MHHRTQIIVIVMMTAALLAISSRASAADADCCRAGMERPAITAGGAMDAATVAPPSLAPLAAPLLTALHDGGAAAAPSCCDGPCPGCALPCCAAGPGIVHAQSTIEAGIAFVSRFNIETLSLPPGPMSDIFHPPQV